MSPLRTSVCTLAMTNEEGLYMTELKADVLNGIDFKVADLNEAEFGRKEIRLAEHEMPGLMALRREYHDVARDLARLMTPFAERYGVVDTP